MLGVVMESTVKRYGSCGPLPANQFDHEVLRRLVWRSQRRFQTKSKATIETRIAGENTPRSAQLLQFLQPSSDESRSYAGSLVIRVD